jgi:hypothetical protein
MVKQQKTLKTSSEYRFRGLIRFTGRKVKLAEVHEGHVVGVLANEEVDFARWKELPHEAMANLRRDEPSVRQFIKTYGRLAAPIGKVVTITQFRHPITDEPMESATGRAAQAFLSGHPESEREDAFAESIDIFFTFVDSVRDSWNRQPEEAQFVKDHVDRHLRSSWSFKKSGEIEFAIDQLWSLICVLLLRDQADGKLGFCANPDCPAPYFRKKRATQKICEEGGCTAWAQRQYALRWWRENESKEAKGRNKRCRK